MRRGGGRSVSIPRLRRPRPDADLDAARSGVPTLRLYLVKPSKYDDDGSVLSFRWGVLPNDTLVVLAGIAEAWASTRPDAGLQIVLWDELTDDVVSPAVMDSVVAAARRDRVELLVGLVGVQTNQYPRARDVALQLRARGCAVAIGGFHVTSHEPTRAFLMRSGVTVVIGEAETSLPRLLDDRLADRLEPEYGVERGLRVRTGLGSIVVPEIDAAPLPALSPRYLATLLNPTFSTIDTSRGCPFVCSFCSVKNVMGRTMRSRDPARVIAWLRDAHDRHGVRNLLVVDDDFYRNPRWRDVLRGVAALRREGRRVSLLLQVDVEASLRGDGFVEHAAEAGCFQVFVGLESFDPANLATIAKVQNAVRTRGAAAPETVTERYARAVAGWHRAGVAVHAGYIIGLPHDTPGCGARAARDLRAIGVDLASFFVYTPFPGTEDYESALAQGRLTSDDFDRYDSTHVVMRHPTLDTGALAREYRAAYRAFYSWRHVARCVATGHSVPGLGVAARLGMLTHTLYYTYADRRGWHPMLGGVWRRRNEVRREAVSDADAARRYLREREPVDIRSPAADAAALTTVHPSL